jgi:methionine sulfoxide reductase catalytic subunit
MTDSLKIKLPPDDPVTPPLSAADDRIILSSWLPPQEGIVPRIRIGRRWISILWAIPIGAAGLVLLVALAQSLRELPSIQAFIKEYPASRRPRLRSTPDFRGGCSSSTS